MSSSVDNSPKALLFDVFGTVVDWRTSIAKDLGSYFATLGIERDWEAFAQDWRALYEPSMQQVRSGKRGYVRLDQLHRENLNALLSDYDLTACDETQLDHVNRVWHRLSPWDDVVAGLDRLKQRYILATLSNGNTELMVNLARFGELPWDTILGSEPAQNYKPEPITYQVSMDWLGLQARSCLMVAAHNSDLAVAKSLGMQTAFIARPTEYGERQTKDFQAEQSWDYVCDSMLDLADQLQA